MGVNGSDPHYAQAARLAHTLGKPVMTAREREQQREAYIAAVDGMATVLKQAVIDIAAQKECCQERWDMQSQTNKRIGDRHQAFVSASFLARLRWFFGV